MKVVNNKVPGYYNVTDGSQILCESSSSSMRLKYREDGNFLRGFVQRIISPCFRLIVFMHL